jgi:hypothetical protein
MMDAMIWIEVAHCLFIAFDGTTAAGFIFHDRRHEYAGVPLWGVYLFVRKDRLNGYRTGSDEVAWYSSGEYGGLALVPEAERAQRSFEQSKAKLEDVYRRMVEADKALSPSVLP